MATKADLEEMISHMREFGLTTLGRAVYNVTFSEMTAPYVHALAVGSAVHGAEILLKSRIAQDNPAAIFKGLSNTPETITKTSIEELFENGRTIQFSEIPDVLFEVSGIKMSRVDQYQQFGRIRNRVLHLGAPKGEYSCLTLKFVFEVIEPLAQEFWAQSIVPYVEEWDDVAVSDGYLKETLKNCNIVIPPSLEQAFGREY